MAIQVTGHTFNLNNGLSYDALYIRLDISLDIIGNQIRIRSNTYLDKSYFQNGQDLNTTLNLPRNISYNRETDGVDILQIAHNYIKDYLINKGISESKISFVDISF
jgi:hypothetical protein